MKRDAGKLSKASHMRDAKSWKYVVKSAKHYKAIGNTEVYLSSDKINDVPWHLCTRCEPGGSHRLDIATSVWFYGKHPSGITFRWSFDIESYAANGKGYYELDTKACEFVLSKLPGDARKSFQKYLSDCSRAVQAKGHEFQEVATRQFHEASMLALLATKEN